MYGKKRSSSPQARIAPNMRSSREGNADSGQSRSSRGAGSAAGTAGPGRCGGGVAPASRRLARSMANACGDALGGTVASALIAVPSGIITSSARTRATRPHGRSTSRVVAVGASVSGSAETIVALPEAWRPSATSDSARARRRRTRRARRRGHRRCQVARGASSYCEV